eukprot:Pgem_evm1s16369
MYQQVQQHCNKCGGKGKVIKKKCSKCNGEKVHDHSTFEFIELEKGMNDESEVVLS